MPRDSRSLSKSMTLLAAALLAYMKASLNLTETSVVYVETRRHVGSYIRFRSRGRCPEDVIEEITQEVFLSLANLREENGYGKDLGRESFGEMVNDQSRHAVIGEINRCWDRFRRERFRTHRRDLQQFEPESIDPGQKQFEDQDELKKLLENCNADERTMLALVAEGLRPKEIATVLGKTEDHVRYRLRCAYEKIQRAADRIHEKVVRVSDSGREKTS